MELIYDENGVEYKLLEPEEVIVILCPACGKQCDITDEEGLPNVPEKWCVQCEENGITHTNFRDQFENKDE